MHEQWRPRLALVVAASGRKEPCPEESIDLMIQLGWMGRKEMQKLCRVDADAWSSFPLQQ